MERNLSSSLTFFYKIIFPAFFTSVYLFTFYALVESEGMQEALPLLIPLIIVIPMFYFMFFHLKKVTLEKNYLYISNFRETIKVNIKNVKTVQENRFINPRILTIEFDHETQFGQKVKLLAPLRFFIFFTEPHPIVKEIQSIIEYYKKK